MVHRRQLNGQEIFLGDQRALWRGALTFFDHATGSVWSQPMGLAISGPLQGTRLDLVAASIERWDDWKDRYPGTTAVATETDPRNTHYDDGVFDDPVAFISAGPSGAAVPVEEVRRCGVVNLQVGSTMMAAVATHQSGPFPVAAYVLDGIGELSSGPSGELVAVNNAGRWDRLTGAELDGHGDLQMASVFPVNEEDLLRLFPNAVAWSADNGCG